MKLTKQYKRAHAEAANGTVYQLPMVVSADGEQKPAPITNPKPLSRQAVARAGFPIINPNQPSMTSNMNNGLPYAVQVDENAYGKRGVFRQERPARDAAIRKQWTITISNGEATTEEFLLGDHHGLLAAALSIPSPTRCCAG